MSYRWTAADISALNGRTVIVTGATSGLGRQTARAMANAGARVVLAVRDQLKGERVSRELAQTASGPLEVRRLDLADLASVSAFAAGWSGPCDVLINNAGIMGVPHGRTKDGFELQFGTNHLGHFALTNLLLPHLTDRVVTVSSSLHRSGRILLDDLNWQRRPYARWQAYSQSKLANLLFTLELQRRLSRAGSRVRALAAHPGYASTNLQLGLGNRWADRIGKIGNALFAQSDDMGALPSLFAATQDLPGGSYVGPDGLGESRGYPTLVGRTSEASDVIMGEHLWGRSAELTGTDFPTDLGAG